MVWAFATAARTDAPLLVARAIAVDELTQYGVGLRDAAGREVVRSIGKGSDAALDRSQNARNRQHCLGFRDTAGRAAVYGIGKGDGASHG